MATTTKNEQKHAAEAKSWSWNLSPRECAQRAKKLKWSRSTIITAMRAAGFRQANINAVVFEFEVGE